MGTTALLYQHLHYITLQSRKVLKYTLISVSVCQIDMKFHEIMQNLGPVLVHIFALHNLRGNW